jgi:hypothetical protein
MLIQTRNSSAWFWSLHLGVSTYQSFDKPSPRLTRNMEENQLPYRDLTIISPPAYGAPLSIPSSSSASNVAPNSKVTHVPQLPTAYSIFPRYFVWLGIFSQWPKTNYCRDIVYYRTSLVSPIVGPLCEEAKPQPPPLFCISIHMGNMITNKHLISQNSPWLRARG